jgi:hypothetical protein
MPKFTSSQIKRLRLEAKHLSRNSSTPLQKAQDKIAEANGYSNWSLLMKNAAPAAIASTAPPYKFFRSEEDMRIALRNLPEKFENASENRYARADLNIMDIWQKFISVENAVDFAIDYITTLLKRSRFQVGVRSQVYWEMRLWLPYVLEHVTGNTHILANRHYKPVGMDVKAFVDYKKHSPLLTKLNTEQIDSFSHSLTGHGYLYGQDPWSSRKAAQSYLNRLQILKSTLN